MIARSSAEMLTLATVHLDHLHAGRLQERPAPRRRNRCPPHMPMPADKRAAARRPPRWLTEQAFSLALPLLKPAHHAIGLRRLN